MSVFISTLLNLLLILYPLTCICHLLEDTDEKYINEGGRLDITIQSLDKNIVKACERVKSLDKVLTQMYKHPPEEGGEDMTRLSRTYNQACLDLLYFTTVDKMKTLKAAEDILSHGGPNFLDVELDEDKIRERFKWDEETMDGLHVIRAKTNEHWYDLWHMYKNLPNLLY